MRPEICLGTAQFGLPYGITNAAGQVEESEVDTLLKMAASAKLRFLDTAQAYGDAEAVLGRTLLPDHSWRLISKLKPQSKVMFTAEDCLAWEQAFERTRLRLRQPCIDALLLHSAGDLLKQGNCAARQALHPRA